MVGILIAAHGDFAAGLISAVELILGKQEKVVTIGLHHGDGLEEFGGKVENALGELDDGDGVLAFVDILGGTPSNTIFKCLQKRQFKAFAGVNMSMVVQAVTMREVMSADEVYEAVLKTASKPPVLLHEMYQDMMDEGDEDDI